MKRIILIMFFVMALTMTSESQNVARLSGSDEKLVREVLQTQQDAWNDGDIEMFMSTYWKSPALVFVGSKGITRGWQATLDRYRRDYPDSVTMGKLRFDILEIHQLERNIAFLIGKYNLTRSIGNASGMFTLVLKKIKGQWLIISDHSS